MSITIVHKIHSGRAMSAEFSGIRLINVYAPSGSAQRTEREAYFNTELPVFFYTASPDTILRGDFICALNTADTTGSFLPSRSLSKIVKHLALVDTCKQDPLRPTFTHNCPTGATRLRPPLRIPRLGAEKIRRRNHTNGVYCSPGRSAPRNNAGPDCEEEVPKMESGPDRDA